MKNDQAALFMVNRKDNPVIPDLVPMEPLENTLKRLT
jgi:hypothetical protein